ncbi:hypothetical protein, partial [Halorubrum lacusprofundi]|uniref:hypothetical protein n=1 Tax=Halorubrum lacusprofundi TaxID=2247 RepID=UPI001A906A59
MGTLTRPRTEAARATITASVNRCQTSLPSATAATAVFRTVGLISAVAGSSAAAVAGRLATAYGAAPPTTVTHTA